jgi:hypothetical protein
MSIERELHKANKVVADSVVSIEPLPEWEEPNIVSPYEYQDTQDWSDLMATWAKMMIVVMTVAFIGGYCWVIFSVARKMVI